MTDTANHHNNVCLVSPNEDKAKLQNANNIVVSRLSLLFILSEYTTKKDYIFKNLFPPTFFKQPFSNIQNLILIQQQKKKNDTLDFKKF